MNIVRRTVWVMVLAMGAVSAPVLAEFALNDSDRVVLFGDVSFGQPYFSEWIDQFLRSRYPELKAEVICFGVAESDAADGNRRLAIEVLPLKPTWVVLSFGLDAAKRKPFQQPLLDDYLKEMASMIDAAAQGGAKVVVMTPPPPDEERNKALKQAKFAEVVEKYAGALGTLASEKNVPVLDWHDALKQRLQELKSVPTMYWTKQGLMPYGVSVAVATDLLLSHWQAEPLDYLIKADWTGSDDISVTMGAARLVERTDARMVIELTGVPVALDMSLRGSIPYKDWPLSKWCNCRLNIDNVPQGGVIISDAGEAAKPFLSQQLALGADVGGVGPLVDNKATERLRNAIRTKLNQFRKFRHFCHQKAPEPELEEGYRLYLAAETALARGAHQVAFRTASRFDVTLTVGLAQEAARGQTEVKPPGAAATAPGSGE